MKRIVRGLVVAVALFGSATATATTEQEREILSRTANEMELIMEMLSDAERRQAPGDTEVFDYTAAKLDIGEIISALRAHVASKHNPAYKREALYVEKGGY